MISHIAIRARLVLTFVLVSLTPVQAGLTYAPIETTDGYRFVLISGEFAHDDNLNEFTAIVRQLDASFVTFDSSGGNVMKAMELGRLIRGNRLSTLQLRGLNCTSACSLAFLGGVTRFAEPGSIGVHKSSFSGDHALDLESAVSAVQHITAEVISFMIENGVDPALLQLALKYESSDIRYLSLSEMQEYRVVTDPAVGAEAIIREHSAPEAQTPAIVELPDSPRESDTLHLPEARTGRVRHSSGMVALKAAPSTTAANVGVIRNGTRVSIAASSERWYRLEVVGRNLAGYMHHTWVAVDQFVSAESDHRHIQIKSFNEQHELARYVRSSSLPISVYLATNGWFAVTLKGIYDKDIAVDQIRSLKSQGIIPADSFVTYGNTYAIKLCCD